MSGFQQGAMQITLLKIATDIINKNYNILW